MEEGEGITLWFLIELVAAFLVAYLAVDISSGYAKGTIYEKLNVAKDLAMQINTLQSLPGNAYLISNPHGYSVKITDNKVEVFEDDNDLVKGTYYFAKRENIDLNFIMENSEKLQKKIVMTKIGNQITVSEKTQT